MSERPEDIDWSLTTWEGSRRAQLRQALKLTLRERLAAVDGLNEVQRHFAEMRARGAFASTRDTREEHAPGVHEPPAGPYDEDK